MLVVRSLIAVEIEESIDRLIAGLGAGPLNDYDSTWIAHHDDFADLLSALNQNKRTEERVRYFGQGTRLRYP